MWVVLGCLSAILLFLWYLTSPFHWWKLGVPCTIPIPIFGNFFQTLMVGFTQAFYNIYMKYPNEPYFGIHFFTRPALLIKQPALIQKVLVSNFDHFTSRGLYSNQDRDPYGSILVNIHGQQWKEIRGELSKYFTPAKIKAMHPYIEIATDKTICAIDKDISNNKPTEFQSLLFNISIDVACQAIFGIESEVFEKEDSIFTEIGEAMFQPYFTLSSVMGLLSPKLFDFLNFKLFTRKCTDGVRNLVRNVYEYRKAENIRREDYIQGMMELIDKQTSSRPEFYSDGTRVPKYDMQQLYTQSIIIYAAAVDSTRLAMTFLLYELANNPDIQEKCRKEIFFIVNESGNDRITISDLPKLVYLSAAVQESLRMHPPTTSVTRECTKDYKIPGGDLTIEKGTLIFIPTDAIHHDEKYFPDPYVFKPERFLTGLIESGTYMPFGLGPRTCLGMNLANCEVKLAISRILQMYEISICEKTDPTIDKLRPLKTFLNGMWLKASPIKKTK